MSATNLLGRPHYELIDRYGFHETCVGRYATYAEALQHKRYWESLKDSPYLHLEIRSRAL